MSRHSALLCAIVVAALARASMAGFADWNPDDIRYSTTTTDFGTVNTCPDGTVILFGWGQHFNPLFKEGCKTRHRDAYRVCEPGLVSCDFTGFDCDNDDEFYNHLVCVPPSYLDDVPGITAKVAVDAATTTFGCDAGEGHLFFGTRVQVSDNAGNNDIGKACLIQGRSMCTPGDTSCLQATTCNSYGDDERATFGYCVHANVSAFTVRSANNINTLASETCPTGMWALYGYAWHYGSGFDSGDIGCMRATSDRHCDTAEYQIANRTRTNPAVTCNAPACDASGSDANSLGMLCMCLPGHVRDDWGCSPCGLGQRPNADMLECEDCKAGTYCPAPDRQAYDCGSNDVYCPAATWHPVNVSNGYYTTGGSNVTRTGQTICPAGTYCEGGWSRACGNITVYCPLGASAPVIPDPGYESTSGNVTHRTAQHLCPEGYYCINGNTIPCGGSHVYCPRGSPSPIPVGVGNYSAGGADDTVRTHEMRCEAGYFCVGGIRTECPAGSASNTSAINCTVCQPGEYNVAGMLTCDPCPGGYFCLDGHTQACGGPDVYCPESSQRPTAVPRGMIGVGNSDTSLLSAIVDCPAQSVCVRGVASACGAGYRCPASPGLEVGAAGYRDECTASPSPNVYCPAVAAGANSSVAVAVDVGFYSVGGRSSCSSCGAEHYVAGGECLACSRCNRFEYSTGGCTGSSDRTCAPCHADCLYGCSGPGSGDCLARGRYLNGDGDEVICPPGSYCTSPATVASKFDCPAGTYGASIGLSSPACDGPCLPGFHCAAGSTSPDAAPCDVACDGCTGATASDCEACAPGFHDVAGECVLCQGCGSPYPDAGLVCEATTRAAQQECPAGFYCTGGELQSACTEGYYCPAGSASPTESDCGDANHYCPAGTPAPVEVSAGFYSIPLTSSPRRRSGQLACPAGSVCRHGWIVAPSCAAHAGAGGVFAESGWFGVDPAGDGSTFAVVWCDHDTYSGQWTVLLSNTGVDGSPMLVGPAVEPTQSDSPLGASYTSSLVAKVHLASNATETLIYRSATEWLVVNSAPLDESALTADGHNEWPVIITARGVGGGTVEAVAYMGYRIGATTTGGDFYISAESRANLPATEVSALSADWCDGMYLYSASPQDADSDGAYHSSLSLGAWRATTDGSCATGETGTATLVAVRKFTQLLPQRTCREVLDEHPTSQSGFYQLTSSTGVTIDAWCDMETDGGGWTVLSAASADGFAPSFVSDGGADELPLRLEPFSLSLAAKASLSALSSQTLFWRGAGAWLVADRALFGPALGTQDRDSFKANLRAADGTTAVGTVAWSTTGVSDGGDVAVLLGEDATFDEHDGNAVLRNSNCDAQLLYSGAKSSSGATYGAAASLGAWHATTPGMCGAPGSGLGLFVAVRDRLPLCRPGYRRSGAACFAVPDATLMNARAASAVCSSADAYLATVVSSSAESVVATVVSPSQCGSVCAMSWLGLSDMDVEGAAVWERPLVGDTYVNWASGDIAASDDLDCTRFNLGTGLWEASSCQQDVAVPLCMVPVSKPPSSCKQILAINPNAVSDHYQIWVDTVGVTDVYCDMDTDGGGWTVLYANPGANTTLSFTSADAANELSASPLSNDAYNLPRAVKAALSTLPSETLVRQSPSVWLRVDHSPVDAAFGALVNSSGLWPAQVTASSGAGAPGQSRGWIGYSTTGVSGGGDFVVSLASVTRGGASADADLVSPGCSSHVLYSLAPARYASALSFGAWSPLGNCDGVGDGVGFSVAVRESEPPATCREIQAADASATSGSYVVYGRHAQRTAGTTVHCDMETDNGGWDVVYSATGADGEAGVAASEAVDGIVENNAFLNTPRSSKVSLSSEPQSELLLWRSSSEWLKLSCGHSGIFDTAFAGTTPVERSLRCVIQSADGVKARGVLAWTTAAAARGGDFAVLLGEDAVFDRHNHSAPLLNSGCGQHLLYSWSTGADNDAAYGSAVSLGTWSASTPGSCGTGAEGSGFALRVALRSSPRGAWVPLLRGASYSAGVADTASTPRASSLQAIALRYSFNDGLYSCDASNDDAAFPWDACAADYSGGAAGFSLNTNLGGAALLTSSSSTELPSGCSAPDGVGPVTCNTSPFAVADNQLMSVQPVNVTGPSAVGRVSLDVDVLVPNQCPPLAPQYASVSCTPGAQWVRVVAGASIKADGPAVAYTVSLPGSGSYEVSQVKAVYKSGFLSCDDTASVDAHGWAGCYPTHSTAAGGAPAFFELLHNADVVLSSPSSLEPATGCTTPPASNAYHGDIVCTASFVLAPGDTLTPTTFDVRTSNSLVDNEGTLELDIWVLAMPVTPLADPVVWATPRGQRWVLLLSNAGYTATPSASAPNYLPDLHGAASLNVSQVRAVHRSGYINLWTGQTENTAYPWDSAVDNYPTLGAGDSIPVSFELMRNGEHVLEAPTWADPPASCHTSPRTTGVPDGDFVCDAVFQLGPGDTLRPTHFDATHGGASHTDNSGTHYVDVWGLVDDADGLDALTPEAYGAVQTGTQCVVQCERGLSLVGDAVRTCQAGGRWTGDEAMCMALPPFESARNGANPVLSWSFDSRTASGLVDDESGETLTLAANGALVAHGALLDTGCAVGSCVRLASCDASATTSGSVNASLAGNAAKSVSVWARVPHTQPQDQLVMIATVGDTSACMGSFGVGLLDGAAVGVLGTCGGAAVVVSGPTAMPVSEDTWHHFVLTHDGDTTTLLVDNTAVGTLQARLATRVAGGFTLGGATASCVGGLAVDEVRVYTGPLAVSQVGELHAAARTCPELPPPRFGSIECSGARPGDTCVFTCTPSPESRLPTSPARTCQANGAWSGTTVQCVRAPLFETSSPAKRPRHWFTFDAPLGVADVTVDGGAVAAGPHLAFEDVGAAEHQKPLLLAASKATTALQYTPRTSASVFRQPSGSLFIDEQACTEGSFMRAAGRLEEALQGKGPKTLAVWMHANSLVNGTVASFGGPREEDGLCIDDTEFDCTASRLSLYNYGFDADVALYASGFGDLHEIWTSSPSPTGRWVHVAGVYDGVDTLHLYVDGELVQSGDAVLDIGGWAEDVLRVGRDTLMLDDFNTACDVAIDDVKVYAYALTPRELGSLMDTGVAATDLMAGDAMDCGTGVRLLEACDASDASVSPAESTSSGAITMSLSGRDSCGVEARRDRQTSVASVAVGEYLSLNVAFSVNPAFRCGGDGIADAACPTATLSFADHPAVVEMVIDEAAAAVYGRDGTMATSYMTCTFPRPLGANLTASLGVAWSVPGTHAGRFHGGQFTLHDMALVPTVGGWGGAASRAPLTAVPEDGLSHTWRCVATPSGDVLNAPALAAGESVPASCDAARDAAASAAGFVSTPPAGAGMHMVDRTMRPVGTRATAFRQQLPLGTTPSARVQGFIRGVVSESDSTLSRSGSDMLHMAGFSCVSGESSTRSTGDATAVATLHTAGVEAPSGTAGSAVTFQARASAGATLAWQITAGDCMGVACTPGMEVASGMLSGGVVPGTATTCTDASVWCEFSASLPRGWGSDGGVFTLWLQPASPATLTGAAGRRAADTVVYVQRIAGPAHDAVGAVDAALVTEGEGWAAAGRCAFVSNVGGAFVEYTAHRDTSSFEVKLQAADLADLASGLYYIDPNGASPLDAVVAYCDHDTDDGGWTLLTATGRATAETSPSVDGVSNVRGAPSAQPDSGFSYALGSQAQSLAVSELRAVARKPAETTREITSVAFYTELFWAETAAPAVRRVDVAASTPGDVQDLFTNADGLSFPRAVGVDSATGTVYWADTATRSISRAAADGTAETLYHATSMGLGGVAAPTATLAVDSLHGLVYFGDSALGVLVQGSTGGRALMNFTGGYASDVSAVAVDVSTAACDASVYFAVGSRIAVQVGMGDAEWIITAGGSVGALAVDAAGTNLYWTEPGNGAVRSVAVGAWTTVSDLVTGLDTPTGLAVDSVAAKLFVSLPTAGSIVEYNLDGTSPVTVVTGQTGIGGIAARSVMSSTTNGGTVTTPAGVVAVAASVSAPGTLDSAEVVSSTGRASLGVRSDSTVPVCEASQARAVFCAAFAETEAAAALCADGSSAVEEVDAVHVCETPVALPALSQVAGFARGVSASAATTTAAAAASASHLAAAPQPGSPLCGALALGQAPSSAAASCAAILADYAACSGGAYSPPSGAYWIQPAGRTLRGPGLTYCAMEDDTAVGAGAGWTLVTPAGVPASSLDMVAPYGSGNDVAQALDTAGQAFDQVLVRRLGGVWCGGVVNAGGAAAVDSAFGIGVSVTTGVMHAFNWTGELVAVPRSATTTGWDLYTRADADDDVSVQSVAGDGRALLWTIDGDAAMHTLTVGPARDCVDESGAAQSNTRVAVFVRDSATMPSGPAVAVASEVLTGVGGLAVSPSPSSVAVSTVASVPSQDVCGSFAVDPTIVGARHPGLQVALDSTAPLPLRDYAEPQCVGASATVVDSTLTGSVVVDTLVSSMAAASNTTQYGAARGCADLLAMGFTSSGWYEVFPAGAVAGATPVRVFCDQSAAGGGWTVVSTSSDATDCGTPAYRAGLEALVAASSQVLLSFRDAAMQDITYGGSGADVSAAAWTVLDTPAAWRKAHPAAVNASSAWVSVRLPGDGAPTLRQVWFGRSPSPTSLGCGGDWSSADSGVTHGRVCVAGVPAPAWVGFAAPDTACAGVCARNDEAFAATSGATCTPHRQFSIAVRGAAFAAPSMLPSAAPRLAAQTASDALDSTMMSGARLDLPTSCVDVARRHADAANGWYTIAPTASSAPQRVFCDVANGGWQRCARVPSSRFTHSATRIPMVTAWDDTPGAGGAQTPPSSSSDCSWALGDGAMVSISADPMDAAPDGSSAVLGAPWQDASTIAHAGVRAQLMDRGLPASFRASGAAALPLTDGSSVTTAVSSFTLVGAGAGASIACDRDAAMHGPLLSVQNAPGGATSNTCASSGSLAGVHGCGCSVMSGAFNGAPRRGELVFWVKPPHAVVFARDPVPPPKPRTCADVHAAVPSFTAGGAAVWPRGDNLPAEFVACDAEAVASGARRVAPAVSCADLQGMYTTRLPSGPYTVFPSGDVRRPVDVLCDFDTAMGEWTEVFAAHADDRFTQAPTDGLDVLQYAAGTAGLVNDARNEVLLAFRNETGGVAPGTPWAKFALPAAWRVRHPGAGRAQDVSVDATLFTGMTTLTQTVTLRFGAAGFVGGGCGGVWDTTSARGRVCLDVAWSPLWTDFADGAAPACGNNTAGSAAVPCGDAGHVFSIAVRVSPVVQALVPTPSALPAAAASCADIQAAGATESGLYPVFPTTDADDLWNGEPPLPASCADVLATWPTAPNGMYTLLPPAAGKAVTVYCDMASGGWMHCGTVVEGATAPAGVALASGLGRSTTDVPRAKHMFSADCSWAMVPGAQVTLSSSTSDASAGVAATLTSDGHTAVRRNASEGVLFDSALRWGATAAVPAASACAPYNVTEFVVSLPGNSMASSECDAAPSAALLVGGGGSMVEGCSSGSGDGVVLDRASTRDGCSALDGEPRSDGDVTALFVRPPMAATQPMFVHCDLASHGGGWTQVLSSSTAGWHVDGDSSGAGLSARAYLPGTQPLVAGAKEVMIALRDTDGGVVGDAVVSMPMPSTWRFVAPTATTAGELVDWPVAVGNSVAQMPRTVRFGSSAVQPAAGSLCGAAWAALDDGVTVEGEGARGFGGLLCVDDPSAPVWYGWATAHTADVCAAGATAVPCTASRQFVISVR